MCTHAGGDVEVWTDEEVEEDSVCDNHRECSLSDESDAQNVALVQWFVWFLLHMQAIYHLTDRVADLFIRFIKAFFSVLGCLYSSCYEIGQKFPTTLYSAHKFLGFNKKQFQRYAVCKQCFSIYTLSDCIEVLGSHSKLQ